MVAKNSEARKCANTNRASMSVISEKTNMKSIAKTKTDFTSFKFDDQDVRVVMKDCEPWFVAADLCDVLHLDTTSIRKLDDDEKGLHSIQTLGGAQQMAVVSESGMYTMILRCRDAVKPGTVPYRVRKWVTAEVLPSIRKTGEYKESKAVSVSVKEKERRYRVRVIVYDNLFGGCVEFIGKADTFGGIAAGIATDLGYKPTGFIQQPYAVDKMRKIY